MSESSAGIWSRHRESPEVPGVVLKYSTLRAITSDIDDARVYGVQFRFGQEAGLSRDSGWRLVTDTASGTYEVHLRR